MGNPAHNCFCLFDHVYDYFDWLGGRLLVDSHQLEHVEVGHLIARTFHQVRANKKNKYKFLNILQKK